MSPTIPQSSGATTLSPAGPPREAEEATGKTPESSRAERGRSGRPVNNSGNFSEIRKCRFAYL